MITLMKLLVITNRGRLQKDIKKTLSNETLDMVTEEKLIRKHAFV